ncbi:hypothetical protein MKW98_001083 [Papaver atlanticum]|uniref:Golgi apparatus membrane protein TVP23 n=1 Tax=Papaver atlanticum TaxID=357466 RepID=A0AAD4XI71_9MAGN|nr:hypothetical protein MKW98_001083 [Papaver atlanticum]
MDLDLMDDFYFLLHPAMENYANPETCFFHVLFQGFLNCRQAGALAFYILSALLFNSFVIIFVVTVLLAAFDFWVFKNVSGRILSLSRMNKKDSWLFWWTLYLTVHYIAVLRRLRFQPDYVLVVGVCLTLSIANIVGFTKCRKGKQKNFYKPVINPKGCMRFESRFRLSFRQNCILHL